MAMSLQHTGGATPMGANLVGDGATFRVWAPMAQRVHVVGHLGGADHWDPDDANLMVDDGAGYWAGFLPAVRDGDRYMYYVVGAAGAGRKRDPSARELAPYPDEYCVVRDPNGYPWHDAGWRPPRFHEYVVYELHIGTFTGPDRAHRAGTFLDVLDRLDYLVDLGVTALEPLPVTEFPSPRSGGYDGTDLYSPEMDYHVPVDDPAFSGYLARVNALLGRRGCAPLTAAQLAPPVNQLKAMVDLCHLSGIAVVLDVVYNHAGPRVKDEDESLWRFDRAADSNAYFGSGEYIGPVPAFGKAPVRQFLIDNVRFFLAEYHVDGFRYDQARVILDFAGQDGWPFLQAMTGTVRWNDGTAVQIAEGWPVDPWLTRPSFEGGADFDAAWHDGLRITLRDALGAAAAGADTHLDLDAVARNLHPPGMTAAWKSVQYVESHDEVYRGRGPRIPELADGRDKRSWYATSRSRLVTGLVLLAPGIPMLFMGQEFLEDKQWSDNPGDGDSLIYWEGLARGEKAMVDHLRFTRELIALRRHEPALCGEQLNVFHVHDDNRVLAFHRWLEGEGRDVVVVATFREQTWQGYRMGLPGPGRWREVFNSDVYENWVNPNVWGNGTGVDAEPVGLHGFAWSAAVTIPANGFVVFAR
jgi:1,4-alpha-glucan branching enzyme